MVVEWENGFFFLCVFFMYEKIVIAVFYGDIRLRLSMFGFFKFCLDVLFFMVIFYFYSIF